MDVVDTSAVRGQILVPKNTRPLAFLLTVASHGTVLSGPASEQQAGHSNPLFSAYRFSHALKHHASVEADIVCSQILQRFICLFLLYVNDA